MLSSLEAVGETGRLRVRVRLLEPGAVVVDAKVRPGRFMRSVGRRRPSGKRRLIRLAPVTLSYRRAGHQTVTLRLSRDHRQALKRSGDARLAIGALAVDTALNRSTARAKVQLERCVDRRLEPADTRC